MSKEQLVIDAINMLQDKHVENQSNLDYVTGLEKRKLAEYQARILNTIASLQTTMIEKKEKPEQFEKLVNFLKSEVKNEKRK